ncbi:ABC transporter ATP-binding protein [Nocardia asteroides]|uniref:ABC transporter ATP-binding protein n=1 Tax=Nocardia asteroides TaxID=1824 RepID=UPI001E5861B9|nr:ABC transporter ATP-binding protein [Nocardia asteroides]UGT62041.1 ABC transporter ATP-binding protein [Nocardia asteroides]
MLELSEVSKSYTVGGKEVRALDRVSLRFDAGTFTAVVGPSGSGKSTLLHLLGTLDSPDSGRVVFRGEPVDGLGEQRQAAFRRHTIGFVFQFFNLLPTLSAWENVALPMLLDGGTLRGARARAHDLLDTVGLTDRAEHRPAQLSGGQMQRVAVARALMLDPPIVLADEPSGNLDTHAGDELMALLARLARDGDRQRAVVMVTHDQQAAAGTDRVVTLRDGRVADDTGREAP